ncbi:MAG: nucleotidyltransferase family protein [Deltaproteobacteria bacterium]|nr:nucleotidyltransferase family protein [Deltaproteobacteria bacterium]
MKALILAAGYATRLYPLTKDRPKPLLKVGGRPVIDWLIDRLKQVPRVEHVHVVTNHKFVDQFKDWQEAGSFDLPISLHDDGSTCEEDRLGAVGDIRMMIELMEKREDLLIAAGDNLFDFDLNPLCTLSRLRSAPVIGVRTAASLDEVKRFGVVKLEADQRISSFEEKPSEPRSRDFALCLYVLSGASLPLVREYLDLGGNSDAPGNYVSWLIHRLAVYGHVFDKGHWFDIGDHDSLKSADECFSKK